MESLQQIMQRFNHGPTDVVGIDLASAGTKVVRMRKANGDLTVVAVGILPPVEFPDALSAEGAHDVAPLTLPPKLKARYASLTISGGETIIKLLSFPGRLEAGSDGKIIENMGLKNAEEYRIAYKVISEGSARAESRVLTVAVSDDYVSMALDAVPTGRPAPFSIEVSGVAAMTAFLRGPAAQHSAEAVASIDFGADTSYFTLFNKGVLALVRRFPAFGFNTVLDRIQDKLGVNRETAQSILTDGAFDISQSVSEAMGPLIKQIVVSRDFVERRENCHITKMYVTGGLIVSRDALDELATAVGVEIEFWNPFEGLHVLADAIPQELEDQQWRFAAALGACLATLEEE